MSDSIEKAYATLGLRPGAPPKDVLQAFESIRRRFDEDPGSDPWDFQAIQQAFDTIQEAKDTPATSQALPNSEPETEVPKHIVWRTFFEQLPLQNETTWFILISMLDVFMTFLLFRANPNAYESNPIANYFMSRWEFDGMLFFKMIMIAFVTILAQIIALRDLRAARQVLIAGSIIVGMVVLYTVMLVLRIA